MERNQSCTLDGILGTARIGSILIMITDGVVTAAGFRRMSEESRWNVEDWNDLCGVPWDVTERGADIAEAIQSPHPQIVDLPLAARRRYVTRADSRKCGVTIGCAAYSDIAVHGKTAKPHTEECRTTIGEQMEHDLDGHERLQVHKRRQCVEPEVEVDWALVAREKEGYPAPLEQQDVQMPVEAPGGWASVKRGADAVAHNEERARLPLRAEGKRGQKHDMQDVLEPRAKTKARLEPRRGQKRESTQPLLALLRFKEARARVRMFLSILLWL